MRGDTIRRMRAERRALKEQLRQAGTLLVWERAERLADLAKFMGIWATHLNPQPTAKTTPEDCQHGQDRLMCYDCGEP